MSTKICPKCGEKPSRVRGEEKYCASCWEGLNVAFIDEMMAYYRALPEWPAFCQSQWKRLIDRKGFWEYPSFIWTVIIDAFQERHKGMTYKEVLEELKHSKEYPAHIVPAILERF